MPNVSRSFAYATASSFARSARPTALIATETRLGRRKPPSATSRPCPSSPRRAEAGIGVSVKRRMAWSVPRMPMVSESSITSAPGSPLFGMRNATVPSCPVVPSRRAAMSQ
ncbi:hypothetical protein P9139_16570 [Curtobacterium flaccumfaciens]|nr:hypothetical protein P9139_16570 [Curtobacterium flaccumfaciens]